MTKLKLIAAASAFASLSAFTMANAQEAMADKAEMAKEDAMAEKEAMADKAEMAKEEAMAEKAEMAKEEAMADKKPEKRYGS